MAVKLRLQRTGRTNYAQWRVVVCDGHTKRDGKCIEILGWYDPHRKEEMPFKVDLERADYWIGKGACPSDRVKYILNKERLRK
ncbi:MAG: 30S ribosomal protein S16 [Planctomycetes bacterium]|nr:30S ribosomal protein S16 [Planctomycetota bacterium]